MNNEERMTIDLLATVSIIGMAIPYAGYINDEFNQGREAHLQATLLVVLVGFIIVGIWS